MIKRKYYLYKLEHSTDLNECFKWFEDLLNKIDFTKFNDKFCFYLNDKLLMYQESKNSSFWVDYNNIWSEFKKLYNFQDSDIQLIIKIIIDNIFIIKINTPKTQIFQQNQWTGKYF